MACLQGRQASLLQLSQLGIEASGGAEFPVVALFDQATALEYKNAIDRLHGGQPVGDDYRRALMQQAVQVTLQGGLCGGIQSGIRD